MNRHLVTFLALGCLAAAALAGDLPLFESNTDVGVTPLKGSAEFVNGEYRITGGGANIWAEADAFHYVWKQLSGDVALTADVRFLGAGAVAHRKAALMIRQNLDAGSAYADVALHGDGLTALQFRPTAGAATQEIRSELNAPVRIRIERRGDRFTVYAGNPGEELKPAGSATVALHDPVYAGLAVCSHTTEVLETAVFSNVKIEPLAPQGPPPPRFASRISIYDLRTKSLRTVYQANEIFEAPNWSRDGKYLLVNSGGRLFRIPVDGASAALVPLGLDASLRCNNDHNLSPDGTQLALSASSPSSQQSQIYIASADGSNPRLLVSATPSYFHGWSPDGRWVSYVAQRTGNYSLYRMTAAGGEEQRLTSKPVYDDGPDYSPDGRWIYFNSNRSGGWDVWRMPAEGAGPDDAQAQRVTSDDLEDWFPHPSPDGKHLLLFSFPKGTTGHNDRMAGVQLRLMRLPGAKLKPARPEVLLTFFGGQGTINVNSWSPDSKRFAFVVFEPLPAGAAK
jgi:regulation of enolase protein 1 (concanavalin A-like superfamily)